MPQEKFAQVLPTNWNGQFPFTNDSDEDFVFTWGKKSYLFPARRTVDMMKMNFNSTPLEVQQIRKFAAKSWAEREFFKSDSAKKMESVEKDAQGYARLNSFQNAQVYSENDLKSGIQRCLTPLPEGIPLVADAEVRKTEDEIHKTDEGEPMTNVIKNTAKSVDPGGILIN